MRRLLLTSAACLLCHGVFADMLGPSPAFMKLATSPSTAIAPSYTGLGDIRSGATHYWGRYCYSAAQASLAKAVNVRRNSDNATSDIGLTASCVMDDAAIAAFCTATTCQITKWYDQIGTDDLVQATSGNQPFWNLSGDLTTSYAGIVYEVLTAAQAAIAPPLSIVGLIKPTSGGQQFGVVFGHLLGSGSGGFTGNYLQWDNSGLTISAVTALTNSFASSSTSATLAANAYGAVGAVFASTTSRTAYLNGVAATTDTTSKAPLLEDTFFMGANYTANANNYAGYIFEMAIYPADTSSNMSAFSTNQHARCSC